MSGGREGTVLITGASGVVGRAVAAELAGFRTIGLVHGNHEAPELDEVLVSDVGAPSLGLSDAEHRRLAREVDVVVHSAALTEWGRPYEQYQRVNVDGTARVAELAHAAGATVHLMSTAFVRPLELGTLDRLRPDNVVRPYITSKLESERLLRDSGVRCSIFRPTNLVGDSRTGASCRPQIVQTLSEWIARGKAPYIPLHPGNLIDVASVDLLAVAVARVIEADADAEDPWWIAYGEDGMTIDETIEALLEHTRARGREIDRPPVVDPTQPLPVPLERIPPLSRSFLRVLIDVSEVTHASGGTLPTSLGELQERFGVQIPSDRDAYRRSLEYWAGERDEPLTVGEAAA